MELELPFSSANGGLATSSRPEVWYSTPSPELRARESPRCDKENAGSESNPCRSTRRSPGLAWPMFEWLLTWYNWRRYSRGVYRCPIHRRKTD